MQESFNVSSSTGNYNVIIGIKLLEQVIEKNTSAIFMVDERLKDVLPDSVTRLILIKADETSKSLECMPHIIQEMTRHGTNRTSHLVAIGGGVVQDIATFAASVFMRGIKWTYMPTTMLGMVDSCIGGKSSINNLGHKNLVGNFYPPVEIIIDINFIQTLNEEQFIGGLLEAAKICYAHSDQEFIHYLNENPMFPMDAHNAKKLIIRTLKNKKWFIEMDEFDQKERLLLNFGHTFGHAIEAGTDFGITHGIAVGIGMIVAAEYSRSSNYLTADGVSSCNTLIQHIQLLFGDNLMKVIPKPPAINLARVLEKFETDKKHRTDSYRVVLPTGEGRLTLVTEEKNDHIRNRINTAYQSALDIMGYPNFNPG
ncbi:MAG: 3-dehydroquinate synthase [Methylococcales bacterium]|nr:3-dehydroquinate synthase [Methylococcales bacterium]